MTVKIVQKRIVQANNVNVPLNGISLKLKIPQSSRLRGIIMSIVGFNLHQR